MTEAKNPDKRPVLKRDKKRAERLVQDTLDAWQAGRKTASVKVHGSDPIGGRYPTTGFTISFSVGLDFPDGVDDAIDNDPKPALIPYVRMLNDELAEFLADSGCYGLKAYWDDDGDGLTLAHHFPPMMGDEPPEVMRCFRAVTAEEKNDYENRTGDEFPPFSDEQWVELRYAGINMFRTVEWRA